MKILDWMGMNYTKWCLCLIAVVVATAGLPLAQSPFVAKSSLAPPAAPPTSGSDASDPILTIKKRVDEVNVLFMPTHDPAEFVRQDKQVEDTILDDHKPPQAIL